MPEVPSNVFDQQLTQTLKLKGVKKLTDLKHHYESISEAIDGNSNVFSHSSSEQEYEKAKQVTTRFTREGDFSDLMKRWNDWEKNEQQQHHQPLSSQQHQVSKSELQTVTGVNNAKLDSKPTVVKSVGPVATDKEPTVAKSIAAETTQGVAKAVSKTVPVPIDALPADIPSETKKFDVDTLTEIKSDRDLVVVMMALIQEAFFNPQTGLWPTYDKSFDREGYTKLGKPGWEKEANSGATREGINRKKNEEVGRLMESEFVTKAMEHVFSVLVTQVFGVKRKEVKHAVRNHVRLHLQQLIYRVVRDDELMMTRN